MSGAGEGAVIDELCTVLKEVHNRRVGRSKHERLESPATIELAELLQAADGRNGAQATAQQAASGCGDSLDRIVTAADVIPSRLQAHRSAVGPRPEDAGHDAEADRSAALSLAPEASPSIREERVVPRRACCGVNAAAMWPPCSDVVAPAVAGSAAAPAPPAPSVVI